MFSLLKRRNHRVFARWQIDQFLGLYDEDKTTFLGRVEDLSIDGMRVTTEATLPVGQIVKIAVEMVGDNGEYETFFLRSRCVWVDEDAGDGIHRMGLQFSGVSPAVIRKIQQIIDRQPAPRSA